MNLFLRKQVCQGSNLKILRTFEAHANFTGSYIKKCVSVLIDAILIASMVIYWVGGTDLKNA